MDPEPPLTALPVFVSPAITSSIPTTQPAPQPKPRASRWIFSKFASSVEQEEVAEETNDTETDTDNDNDDDEQVVNAHSWVPISPVSMDTPDDFRKMVEDEDEYTSEEEEEEDEAEPSEACEDDRCRGTESTVWHCVDCDSSYCR